MRYIKENFFLSFLIFSSVFLAVIDCFFPVSADVALHYYHSIRMIEDGGLYTRWVEVMPPTIYLIYALPVYLHKLTQIGYGLSMNVCINVMALFSLYIIDNSLKHNNADKELRKNFLMAGIVTFFILPVIIFSVMDRDSLFFILFLPWLINKLLKYKSSLLVIIMAAVGCSIKQYNYLFPILFLLFSGKFDKDYLRNLFSKENLTFAAVVIVLNVIFMVSFPAYFTELLPVLLISYKSIHSYAIEIIVISTFIFCVLTFYLTRTPELKAYLRRYITLFITSLLVVLLNGNIKYDYSFTLSLAVICIFHIIYLYQNDQTRFTLKLLVSIVVTITILILFISFYYFVNPPASNKEVTQCDDQIAQYTRKPYIFLSIKDWAFAQDYSDSERVYNNRNHMFALDHLWMIPWLYNHVNDPKAARVKEYIAVKMREALQRNDDITILVRTDKQHDKLPEDFNILDFFKKELGLAEDLKAYKKVKFLDCRYLEIWRK